MVLRTFVIGFIILCAALPASAAESVDYLTQVKTLLAGRCFACHGALKQEAGLRLDTAASIRRGGESGSAIVPGNSRESLLIARITDGDPESRMPPSSQGTPLAADEIRRIRAWIDAGAMGPEDEAPEADPREHWAFRAPARPAVPQPRNEAWIRNPIDAFLAAEHERRGLRPQSAADKRILLRRVYLDLTGLPPTLDEIEGFVADASPLAYERVVDRLLDSPAYGERWGRHWMDIWRYSDWWGLGAEVRNSQKHIWHWRDWIVESLNADVGYDEMLRQMLAADELYPNDLDRLRGTGFLARQYFKFNRNTWLDETVEHTAKAFLGLTLNCAKCHDHKFDPLAQKDYYRFRAFFEPYQVRLEQVPGEVDYERDAVPRAFDCNLEAATFLFQRGDEKHPVKDEPLSPGLPALLAFEPLAIEAVSLPAEAYQPGLRSWVLESYLQVAERDIANARAALEAARAKRTEVAAAAAQAAQQSASAGPSAAAATVTSEPAQAAVTAAERALAAAELNPAALRARAAADKAKATDNSSDGTQSLSREASHAERTYLVAKSSAELAQAELQLLSADAKEKSSAEQKVAATRDAAKKANEALAAAGAEYTPLRGALKTLESNLETEESRTKPFPATSTGRRTALARWMTDQRNPLTARVAVNHMWMRHFHTALVPTIADFGRKGTPPTHPALFDWLSVELMETGWSMKHLHRLMVTSNAYRMSSSMAGADTNMAADPENRFYWRMNAGRMEAQVVRDAMLFLSGELDLTLCGPPVDSAKEEFSRRRSMYFVHSHNEHHRFLTMFDDANVLDCYRREESIVPQQALALANSRQSLESATNIAAVLARRMSVDDDDAFVRAAFLAVLATEPNADELAACRQALSAWKGDMGDGYRATTEARARANLVLALINHNDFITIR